MEPSVLLSIFGLLLGTFRRIGWWSWLELRKRFHPELDPDRILSDRFKVAYSLIKDLADTTPPYLDAKVGALQKELDFLRIRYPVNSARWPKYLHELKRLSKKGKFGQAREIPDYLDTTPQ